MVQRRTLVARAAIGTAAAAVAALTATQAATAHGSDDEFRGNLKMLNHSGVHGKVRLNADDGTVEVKLRARGLEEMQVHMSHIHGHGDGNQATCPKMSADTNDDGVLTFAEGLPDYGPVMVGLGVDLTNDDELEYERTFTMTGATGIPPNAAITALGDLDQYVVVVHGMTLADDPDTPAVERAYVASLPVACAVIKEH
jgi:hypothetical protein